MIRLTHCIYCNDVIGKKRGDCFGATKSKQTTCATGSKTTLITAKINEIYST